MSPAPGLCAIPGLSLKAQNATAVTAGLTAARESLFIGRSEKKRGIIGHLPRDPFSPLFSSLNHRRFVFELVDQSVHRLDGDPPLAGLGLSHRLHLQAPQLRATDKKKKKQRVDMRLGKKEHLR